MMLGIIFGILAMVSYGLSNAISKEPLKEISPIEMIFYRGIIVTLLLGIIVSFIDISFEWKYVFISIILMMFGYLGLVFFYKSISKGDVGISTPIANSSFSLTVVLSMIFYHETFATIQLIGVFLVFMGIIILSYKRGKINKSVLYAILVFFLWGTSFFLFKIPVVKLGPLFAAFVIEASNLIFSLVHLLAIGKKITKPKKVIPLSIVGILGGLGTLFSNFSMTYIGAAASAMLSNSGMAIAVLYGRIFYDERFKAIKYVGIATIFLGIILYGIG